jgi:hypothetical protein
LREHGIHFVKVPRPLMVRIADVEQYEEEHTIYPEARGPNRKSITKKEMPTPTEPGGQPSP